MTNFDVRIINFDTSLEIRRKLAGQHNTPTVEQIPTTGGRGHTMEEDSCPLDV